MKYLMFLMVVALMMFWLMQRRQQKLADKQRLAQQAARKQAEFVAQTDALNPHLREHSRKN